jgi:hypothetical protein
MVDAKGSKQGKGSKGYGEIKNKPKITISFKYRAPIVDGNLLQEISYARLESSSKELFCPVCKMPGANALIPICGSCKSVYGQEMLENLQDLIERIIAYRSVVIRGSVFEFLDGGFLEGESTVKNIKAGINNCVDDFGRLPDSFINPLVESGIENYYFHLANQLVRSEIPRYPLFFDPEKKSSEFHAAHPEIPLNLLKDACDDLLEDRHSEIQRSIDLELNIAPFIEDEDDSVV